MPDDRASVRGHSPFEADGTGPVGESGTSASKGERPTVRKDGLRDERPAGGRGEGGTGRGSRARGGIDILDGPLPGGVFRFAMPVALTGILEQLSNLIDTVMVGRLTPGDAGTVAQAAVGANAPITAFVVALFVGVSLGANVTVANAIGRRDEEDVSRAVHTAIVMSLGGLLVLALGELVARPLLTALEVPPEALGEAITFLRMYSLCLPFMLLYNFEAALLRSVGKTALPLHALCLSAVVNVALGYLFIGALGWGVAGSALATGCGYLACSSLLFVRLVRTDSPVRVTPSRLRLDVPAMREILRVGLPAGIQSAVFSVANILIQSDIDELGTTIMAASSASQNIEAVVYNLLNSYTQACTTFVGQNSGAARLDRCKRTLGVSLVEALVTAMVLIVAMFAFGRGLVALFNDDPEVVEYGYQRLCIIVPAYVFSAVYEDLSGYLRGFGISLQPAIITTVVICGIRAWWVLEVFPQNPSLSTVMAVYPISLGVNALAILVLLLVMRPARAAERRAEARGEKAE